MRADFARMRTLGANTLRLYFPPPERLLDLAGEFGLRVLIDVPWEKHRCFFEDWTSMESARREIRSTARRCGRHPAVLAVSVANEFPGDVVRFYGHARLERFVDTLLDIVHQEAPECLATFANFPTTEFLQPRHIDFHCFNVYLHDPETLGAYLDRLQHLAGSLPLILGEYGVDSLREGEDAQSRQLAHHVERVFRHGLAGSIVFSYTDDWFTGGHQVEDWAFGVVRRDRSEKPAAAALRDAWLGAPRMLSAGDLPAVSVVVCSYNGARTLEECLDSLMWLNYPDYEVILVDDGSSDATPQIAEKFPQVRYLRQENRGLSVARNVGAWSARGEIVAYTDDDCMADPDWLAYLVQAMSEQQVDAIGGPNITPASDGWTAKCVAVSPGNPSHVMLDDRQAEHVPGCNMAFRRDVLVGIGGFDPQFRQAGDDIDLCWRLLDAGHSIGFAPAALVWHHRRCSVRAYLKQQKGYGRAEAMVQFKHPQRFGPSGLPSFSGVIYGDGAIGLPVIPPRIYHGRFGSALFQTIYHQQVYGWRARTTSLEWHGLAGLFVLFAMLQPQLLIGAAALWGATAAAAAVSAARAPLPPEAPRWCRPLVALLFILQPLIRGWHRCYCRLSRKRLSRLSPIGKTSAVTVKRISPLVRDLYWENRQGVGREQLLEALVDEAAEQNWCGDFQAAWAPWDVELVGNFWHSLRIRTVTEELGWPRRFTRARCSVSRTLAADLLIGVVAAWVLLGGLTQTGWALGVGALLTAALLIALTISRIRCLGTAVLLLCHAAIRAGLQPRVRPQQWPREAEPVVETIVPAGGHAFEGELALPLRRSI